MTDVPLGCELEMFLLGTACRERGVFRADRTLTPTHVCKGVNFNTALSSNSKDSSCAGFECFGDLCTKITQDSGMAD
jgi:hypothetical protein